MFLIFSLALISGCQKSAVTEPLLSEASLESAANSTSKQSPVIVEAGSNRRVVYPASSSATLSGSGSSTQGRAISYLWQQVRGNSTALISRPDLPNTNVSKLVPGLYTFTLTVKDDKGVSRVDSASVTVLEKVTWNVGGTTREALVHPATGGSGPAPIIFAFHGHGGTDLGFAERNFELNWPEAIVVYPQGLPTPSGGDKEGRNSGWQNSIGEVDKKTGATDKDLKFFDAMLRTLKKDYRGNSELVFSHGWSDGGSFVYNILWSARVADLAGISPSSVTLTTTANKQPLPVIHSAGKYDDKVKFSSQQKTVEDVRKLNKCNPSGITWATGRNGLLGTKYVSPAGNDVVFLQYDGDHSYPFTVPAYIVQFFKEIASK